MKTKSRKQLYWWSCLRENCNQLFHQINIGGNEKLFWYLSVIRPPIHLDHNCKHKYLHPLPKANKTRVFDKKLTGEGGWNYVRFSLKKMGAVLLTRTIVLPTKYPWGKRNHLYEQNIVKKRRYHLTNKGVHSIRMTFYQRILVFLTFNIFLLCLVFLMKWIMRNIECGVSVV